MIGKEGSENHIMPVLPNLPTEKEKRGKCCSQHFNWSSGFPEVVNFCRIFSVPADSSPEILGEGAT